MGHWEEREHTADALIAVWGADLADLFATAAEAMFALLEPWGGGEPLPPLRVALEASDVESLLVDWLNELLFRAETVPLRSFHAFRIHHIDGRRLEATARGRTVEGWRTYIKAATFHNLHVRCRAEGCEAEVTFDL